MSKADTVYGPPPRPRKGRPRRPALPCRDLALRDLALLATVNPEAGLTTASPPHPDAELLALGAELEALGRGLHDWPGDDEVERLDARLAEVEDRIAALAPATGAGLAVKLRLACAWRPADGPALPRDPRPGGGLARLLRRLVAEAEALDRARGDLP